MSVPENPLDIANSSTHRHMLVAFKYAEDAFRLDLDNNSKIDPTTFAPGDQLPDLGENVVVINEFSEQEFAINEAVWDFDFIPNIGVSTSASVGSIVVTDRFVGYSFLDFLRNDVLSAFNSEAATDQMSLSHATFALKTYFVIDGSNADAESLINVSPFFFNIDSIESVPMSGQITPSSHILHVIGAVNSLGLVRSMSSMYQMNITHKDGNVHDEIQTVADDVGLETREVENNNYQGRRKERLDRSKPMLTLKDMFEGLEADLNQQKFAHQGQLQRWLREVRDDHVDKISVAPQQTKPPVPEELPIDFVVDLDEVYFEYNVDNRNMPFEQPDTRQENVGLRVLPIRTGNDIIEVVERIMLLSQRVGEDARYPNPLTYKTTVTAERKKTNRYVINIKIRRYALPINVIDEEANTGPGDNPDPLQFFISDVEERDRDIISFKSNINYRVGDQILEVQNTENPSAGVVYADREQTTAERRPDLSFFGTLYSGIRPMIGSYIIDGLESGQRAGDVLDLMDPYTYTQTTDYEMVIRGNPNLLSDINRNPRNVIDDVDGPANYYARPEVNPMYVKLTIFLKNQALFDDGRLPERFHFDGFMHLCRVVNMFGVAGGQSRTFYQKLMLKRTDDTI